MHEPETFQRKTVLFIVTEDWYFISHRLPLAVAAQKAGFHVVIASRFGVHWTRLKSNGFTLRPIQLRRRGASLVGEVLAILELRRLLQELEPVIVHNIALKPVVFGSVAAVGLRRIAVVNAVAGLGFLFTSQRLTARLLRPVVTAGLRVLFRRPRTVVIVQNESDRRQLLDRRLIRPAQARLMRGAGVELDSFIAMPEADGVPIVAYAGRMLWSKGVGDFVAAARELKSRSIEARFVLVGEPDTDSADAVAAESLQAWAGEGVVELWGKRSDMPEVLSAVHIVCLPSVYGEGVPKILLEAAACGRPVVTTNWPGCRDAVLEGETGLLVAPGDVGELADALARLLTDTRLRRKFGLAARRLAEKEFDVKSIVEATLAVYAELST